MVRFNLFALSFLFSSAESAQYLRSADLTHLKHRNLSYEKIANYGPRSQVTDHNAIDLDQKVIEEQIALQTESSFVRARAVYENGGHSKSYARLKITSADSPVESDGTLFSGTDSKGFEITGLVYASDKSPSDELWLEYTTTDSQDSYVRCQVGALTLTGDENTEGCFQAAGTISSGPRTYTYEYIPEQDNRNGRTIKGFSTAVQSKMLQCPNCPYRDAKFFVDYYGNPNYADKWINAAFLGSETNFASGRGNADFSAFGLTGRGEAAKKGTAYMAIFMYIIREFEDALDDCQVNCIACNDDPVHAWDEGVAFYSGSLEGTDGSPTGVLLHELADKRCANFDTCIDENDSKSAINDELFKLFNIGQGQLLSGKCEEARATKEKIVDLMYVPLIQGTIRYAYKVGEQAGGEKEKAEGAVFAASILPRIHAASESAATEIYNNMRVGASSTDFKAVKKAFESVYSDLNIKCSDVGGLLNPEGDYYEGAGPCKDKSGASSKVVVGATVGSIAGVAALAFIGFFLFKRGGPKKGVMVQPSFDESAVKEMH